MNKYVLSLLSLVFLCGFGYTQVAPVEVQTGITHFEQGQFVAAIDAWEQALRSHALGKAFFAQAEVQFYLAKAYQRLGQNWLSINRLNKAQKTLQQVPDSIAKAALQVKILNALGRYCSLLEPEIQSSKYIKFEIEYLDRCKLLPEKASNEKFPNADIQVNCRATADKPKCAYLDEALTLTKANSLQPTLKQAVYLSRANHYLQQFKQADLYDFSFALTANLNVSALNNYLLAISESPATGSINLDIKTLNGLIELLLQNIEYSNDVDSYFLDYANHIADTAHGLIFGNATQLKQLQQARFSKPNDENSLLEQVLPALSALLNHYASNIDKKLTQTHDTNYILLHSSDVIRQLAARNNQPHYLKIAYDFADKVYETQIVKPSQKGKNNESVNLITQSYAYGYLANIYQQAGQRQNEILGLYDHAIHKAKADFCGLAIPIRKQGEHLKITQNISGNETGAKELAAQWYRQKGKVYHSQGNLDAAINNYQQAVNLIEYVRQDIERCSYGSSCSFENMIRPVYRELIQLFIKRAHTEAENNTRAQLDNNKLARKPHLDFCGNDEKEAAENYKRYAPCRKKYIFEASDYQNALSVLQGLNQAELASYFFDPCVARAQQANETDTAYSSGLGRCCLADLVELDKTAVIIYPLIFAEEVVILVQKGSNNSDIEKVTLSIKPDVLKAQIKEFTATIRERSYPYLAQANALYNNLISPLQTQGILHNIETIVIVPDQHLRMLPWAALHDGQQYLIQQYALAINPGTAIPKSFDYKQNTTQKLLLAGLSNIDYAEAIRAPAKIAKQRGIYQEQLNSPLPISPLPFVKKELECIEKLFDGQQKLLLLGKNFTQTTLQDKLSEADYRILHIASHALFNSDIRESVILTGSTRHLTPEKVLQLADGSINIEYIDAIQMDDLEKLINISKTSENLLAQPIEMLVLSACSTAVDEEKAALGLSGIAVKAGVPSVLGTLWNIDDMFTSVLMSRFYNALDFKQGQSALSKAKALQQAQIYMLTGRFLPNSVKPNACEQLQRDYIFSRNAVPINLLLHPYYWSPFIMIGNWLPFSM